MIMIRIIRLIGVIILAPFALVWDIITSIWKVVLTIVLALWFVGCSCQPQIVPQRVNIPVKVKLDPLTYNKVMELPRVMRVQEVTQDGLLEYTIDLQNKYLELRNVFYNTVEVDYSSSNKQKGDDNAK